MKKNPDSTKENPFATNLVSTNPISSILLRKFLINLSIVELRVEVQRDG